MVVYSTIGSFMLLIMWKMFHYIFAKILHQIQATVLSYAMPMLFSSSTFVISLIIYSCVQVLLVFIAASNQCTNSHANAPNVSWEIIQCHACHNSIWSSDTQQATVIKKTRHMFSQSISIFQIVGTIENSCICISLFGICQCICADLLCYSVILNIL